MPTKQYAGSFDLNTFVKQVEGQRFPPVDKWEPEFCGNIDMRIAVDGTWFYMGTPIGREKMVRLFASVLRKDADDQTYLVTPVEKIGITVDDAHFVAVSVEVADHGDNQSLCFVTNTGDKVIADNEHPIRVEIDAETGEPRPYILVRGRLEALISRSVYYELVEHGDIVEQNGVSKCSILSNGVTFSLGEWSYENMA
ncbi:DUF1285 domain-containing protein [Kordiimonas aquimaris]|uniref:DUF1285 domain-containing protein n=1 Tax=Kordiimonas aquimaris TaxID=707591 RepID=UPI0021D03E77|nr:DUF1285 domain-containing protein [Kordiimonas aquimaris]